MTELITMPTPQPLATSTLPPTPSPKEAAAARAIKQLETLYHLCRSRRLMKSPATPGLLEATLSLREVRSMFDDEDLADRYPLILTYAQAAELVQVSQETLKGWFCQGKFAQCVRRGKPARVLRDCFVQKFLADEYKVNDK